MIDKFTLLTALTLAVPPSSPSDPLASLPSERIDLELKDAPVRDVMLLVESISGDAVEVDACVQGTLTLELNAVTLRSFLVVVGDTLSLTYARGDDGALLVGCAAPHADRKDARVDLNVVGAPLPDVLEVLSATAGTRIHAFACDDVLVDLNASNAPASAVLHTVAAQASATVEPDDGGLLLRCGETSAPRSGGQ